MYAIVEQPLMLSRVLSCVRFSSDVLFGFNSGVHNSWVGPALYMCYSSLFSWPGLRVLAFVLEFLWDLDKVLVSSLQSRASF